MQHVLGLHSAAGGLGILVRAPRSCAALAHRDFECVQRVGALLQIRSGCVPPPLRASPSELGNRIVRQDLRQDLTLEDRLVDKADLSDDPKRRTCSQRIDGARTSKNMPRTTSI